MPMTMRQRDASLHRPAFCELLPVRDFLDNVIVRSNGAFVAGYELGGINSYYHSDEARNQTKFSLEALVRSLAERSMRMQVRFEIVEGLGDLTEEYKNQLRTDHPVVQELDRLRLGAWKREGARRVLPAANASRVLLLGSSDSPRNGRQWLREETGQCRAVMERIRGEMHSADAPRA